MSTLVWGSFVHNVIHGQGFGPCGLLVLTKARSRAVDDGECIREFFESKSLRRGDERKGHVTRRGWWEKETEAGFRERVYSLPLDGDLLHSGSVSNRVVRPLLVSGNEKLILNSKVEVTFPSAANLLASSLITISDESTMPCWETERVFGNVAYKAGRRDHTTEESGKGSWLIK